LEHSGCFIPLAHALKLIDWVRLALGDGQRSRLALNIAHDFLPPFFEDRFEIQPLIVRHGDHRLFFEAAHGSLKTVRRLPHNSVKGTSLLQTLNGKSGSKCAELLGTCSPKRGRDSPFHFSPQEWSGKNIVSAQVEDFSPKLCVRVPRNDDQREGLAPGNGQ
jgi:hypothetical protein